MAFRLNFGARKAAFHYPLGDAPRTAVLVPWFREPRQLALRRQQPVRVFAKGWTPDTALFSPAAIVGTREQLLNLIAIPSPADMHALIAVSRWGQPLLTASERERLWRAFHVPVFEQIIGATGRVLAAECEAHDGLHVAQSTVEQGTYSVDESPCPCGKKTARLSSATPAERVRSAAAYAR
ncbi:MAG: hypothetical protein ABI811_13960 [Acidobacteriota bacterium]